MDLSFTDAELAFAAEIRAWLAEHLDLPPAFASLDDEIAWGRAWQAKLAADRWVGIHWPAEYGGRSATPVEVALYNMEYARSRALQPVNRVGINLAGPTLLAHGTDAQKARWLPRILDAAEIWCQLFSEPGAGSDLASLATRATPTDGGWLLTGQKVWTSYAQYARWGIALVRTDPDAPKHRGISYVVVDMEAPGIEIRPLVQITGEAEFNEVFFDDVFVPEDHLVGGLHDGWAVANTTLAHERGTAFPFKEQVVHEVYLDELYALAAERDRLDDVEVADALAQSFVELRLLRLDNWRTLSRLAAGIAPGAESSITKLRWTDVTQHLSEHALTVLGPDAPRRGKWSRQWLWSKAASIAGGTSEVQRTIIGERMLGLPREGGPR
jgi:alkylation response protein AidB-like acyl-CoA dehydrogenase